MNVSNYIEHEPNSALEALCQETGTTPEDWNSMDGPETGVGVERWYVHTADGREAYTVDDQGSFTIEVSVPDRKMSNYTAGQNHEPLEHEMAEYVELEVTLRSKTTFGTDKETIRVWDGQSAKDVAERTAQGYGAEVVEIRNPDGSIYEEALKVEDSHSPGM